MTSDSPDDRSNDPSGQAVDASQAVNLLKAMAHDGRLMILRHLASGPKNVSELETLLSSRQPVVSQCLSRLRLEGIVSTRRQGKEIYYSIADPKVREVLIVLDRMFPGSGQGDA